MIGLIRFLPFDVAQPDWGEALAAVGLFSAFYGVAIGITQTNPKTVLAYPSVSQMGLIAAVIGMGLALLVDDAMTTTDATLTRLAQGDGKIQAATFAFRAYAFSMLAGTLVTIAGFVPVGFAVSSAGESMWRGLNARSLPRAVRGTSQRRRHRHPAQVIRCVGGLLVHRDGQIETSGEACRILAL